MTPARELRPGSRRSPWGGVTRALGRGAPYRTALPGRRRFRPHAGLTARPLTPPVTTRRGRVSGRAERPGSLSPRSRQRARLPRPGAPSIDRCPPRGALARFPGGARHRARGFATASRLPGFLEPPPICTGSNSTRLTPELSPRDAACRIPPVDFCNRHGFRAQPRNDQIPHTLDAQPGVAPR